MASIYCCNILQCHVMVDQGIAVESCICGTLNAICCLPGAHELPELRTMLPLILGNSWAPVPMYVHNTVTCMVSCDHLHTAHVTLAYIHVYIQ